MNNMDLHVSYLLKPTEGGCKCGEVNKQQNDCVCKLSEGWD